MIDEELSPQELEQRRIEAEARARELARQIDLGFAVKKFLAGELGQQLMNDADHQIAELVAEYLKLDADNPEHREKMREVRFSIRVAEHWSDWFQRYIREADAAEAQFHEDGVIPEGM